MRNPKEPKSIFLTVIYRSIVDLILCNNAAENICRHLEKPVLFMLRQARHEQNRTEQNRLILLTSFELGLSKCEVFRGTL